MDSGTYQQKRQELAGALDLLLETRSEMHAREQLFLDGLPAETKRRMVLLDKDGQRLRHQDLLVAFVGGFSAGKSSVVNAFLGRYLLPESTKITTAVPTYIRRAAANGDAAELHYLNEAEVEALGELYRAEIATSLGDESLASLPASELIDATSKLAEEGRSSQLVRQFAIFQEERKKRDLGPRGHVERVPLAEAHRAIRDERAAMFMDRVVLHVANAPIPSDVVLVDLPGVSVPNPRHREVTFRFVRETAHAVVFVLMSPRIFDKDELEILESIRTGEARIAEKTFWVLNRWDSLTSHQRQQTLVEFEAKMKEYRIPAGFSVFRTNALHGLLAQLVASEQLPQDPALLRHLDDYDRMLARGYQGSHAAALKESQIPLLQEAVTDFLDNRLRATVLASVSDNAKQNFCEPLLHHLRRAKHLAEEASRGDLEVREKETLRRRADDLVAERTNQLKGALQGLRNEVATERSTALRSRAQELVEQLRQTIGQGSETDAFEIYQQIISEKELRKYPYYFEIEIQIVDQLNTTLKRAFREIVQIQVQGVFNELVARVNEAMEPLREDIEYSVPVLAEFEDILERSQSTFGKRIDGVVMQKAAQLDELLVRKPKNFFGLLGGNELLEGLEKAAKVGFESLRNSEQAVRPEDLADKTRLIREALSEHYIAKVREYHEEITESIFPIIINNMQELQKQLSALVAGRYRSTLERCLSQAIEEEFGEERRTLQERARRFRNLIERIEEATTTMSAVVGSSP